MTATRTWTIVLLLASSLLAAALVLGGAAPATPAETGWDTVPALLNSITVPSFPARDFPITDFGAVGDGRTDSTGAFREAITACNKAGGGRVVVPTGRFLTGAIHLKSNVNLHITKDATVLFSTDPKDYLPQVYTRFESTECMNFSPLIYAFEQENIALTGEGTLDGQGGEGRWWHWKGPWGGNERNPTGWKPGDPNQLTAVARLRQMAADGVPVRERIFGEKDMLRPNFIVPYRSKNVLIEGVTVRNSPMWVVNPVLCKNVTVRGLRIISHGPNNDGCNPECSRNVLIENNYFDTGDDCIAIKSGRDYDGRRVNTPSENIVIRKCQMKDGHGGVVIGSETAGGVRNVYAEDCVMDSPHLDRALRIKSNTARGGLIENVYLRNIEVGQVAQAAIRINMLYAESRGDFPPTVRNINVRNLTCKRSRYALRLVGLPEQPVRGVVIQDCRFTSVERPSVLQHVADLTLKNVTIQ